MLEKYEQKKLIEYLLEGLLKCKKLKTTKDFVNKFEDMYENINDYYANGSIDFYLETKYDENLSTEERFHKSFKEVISQLKKEYEKVKNAKPSNRAKCFKIIQKLFNLSDEDTEVFALFVRNESSETFGSCLCLASDKYRHVTAQNMCKCYLKNSPTMHDSVRRLQDLGLLDHDGHRGLNVGIPDSLKEVINNDIPSTNKKIIEKILGICSKTSLNKRDFEHLKDDFNILQTILSNAVEQNKKGINILLYGEVGTGKTEFAKVVAKQLKMPLYEVCYEDSDNEEPNRYERLSDLQRKMSICSNIDSKKLILFDEAEDIFKDTFFSKKTESKAFINKMLENNATPVIWTTNDIYNMDKAYLRRFTYSIKFKELSDDVQLKFLKKEFKKNDFKISDDKILELSKKYDLSPSVITNSIMLTKLTNSEDEKLEDFVKNQIILLNRGHEKGENFNVNKKSENYNFNLVNTDTKMETLTDKIKLTGKLNFSLCLYGEAGTGKSEYAKQLADKLELDVIFRRASDLMSKWVGETEQNIAKAFKEARDKKAVLIFDEADSLLQSRGNAQRSWEISQVNEMLTWMESHPYPFICTTNFMDSLDEASLRRFTFKIKFKYMNTEQVKLGFKHFFDKDVSDEIANIQGLTAGDFATVKKKISFLGTDDVTELKQMLEDEVKVKKSKELGTSVGF